MYKGAFNKNGDYTGFYVEGIHENIPEPHIELTEEEWQQALSKNYKVIEGLHTYVPFVQSQEDILEEIRVLRNGLLTESDWTQMNDSPLTREKKTEWQKYRKALRDLTISYDLTAISWPTQPL